MKSILALLLLTCLTFQTGCQSISTELSKLDAPTIIAKVKPYVQISTAQITSYVLKQAKNDADRKKRAIVVTDISVALRFVVASKKAPTQAELQELILHVSPHTAESPVDWSFFAVTLSAVYGGYVQQFPGNVQVALEIIDLIANGLADGARPYLK